MLRGRPILLRDLRRRLHTTTNGRWGDAILCPLQSSCRTRELTTGYRRDSHCKILRMRKRGLALLQRIPRDFGLLRFLLWGLHIGARRWLRIWCLCSWFRCIWLAVWAPWKLLNMQPWWSVIMQWLYCWLYFDVTSWPRILRLYSWCGYQWDDSWRSGWRALQKP